MQKIGRLDKFGKSLKENSMKLKNVINEWNQKLDRFPNYVFTLEKSYDITYKNSSHRLVKYGSVWEKDLEKFEKRTSKTHCLESSSYFLFLNVKETSVIIGRFHNQSNVSAVFTVYTEEFKRLKKFLKKEFLQSAMYPLYKHKTINLDMFFKKHGLVLHEELPSFETNLKEVEVYKVQFSDGVSRTYLEKELKYAMENVSRAKVSIVNVEKTYIYETR